MALRNIVKDGDPILKKKSRNIEDFNERLSILIDDMIETMHNSKGVGLAAVQVGVLRRVIVVEVDDFLAEVINPVFEYKSEETEFMAEGCLSFPEQQAVVERPKKVKVKGQNRIGKDVEYEVEGFLARVFCHEIDHLDGVTFLDVALSDEDVEKYLEQKDDIDKNQ